MISSNFSDVYDLCTTTYNVTPILPGKALSPPQLSLLSTLSLAAKSLDTPQILLPIIESPNAQWTLLSLILLATPFVLVYITTYLSYTAQVSSNEPIKSPPTVPYITPFLGSAVDFVLNPKKYVTGMKNLDVYGIKLANYKIFLLRGPELIQAIWRYKGVITSPAHQAFVLIGVFGMNPKAVQPYHLDDSGLQVNPHPKSNVAPHNRIDHLTHVGFMKLLTGDGLSKLYQRWAQEFNRRLQALAIGDEWGPEIPDIMDYWQMPLTASMNVALAGPLLECINPDFTREFNEFLTYVHPLIKRVPRWLIPRAFRLRKKLVGNVMTWQNIARSRASPSDIDTERDYDPWWGSECFRERQKYLSKVDGWDHDSLAISDFGLLWGANINVHAAAIWTIIEIFSDATLLSRVRAELRAADFQSFTTNAAVDKLISLPLLQSIYSEVLRLRVEVQHVLYSNHDEIQLNEYRFPRRQIIMVPSGPAHMNADAWNTRDGEHPLDTFWADRFLVYPNDPLSGPARKSPSSPPSPTSPTSPTTTSDPGKPKFKDSSVSDSFIPYGVGERTCPGRFFSKREIIAFCATIVNDYDVDLLTKQKKFEHSPTFYGFGTQRPASRIPFRIRKRKE